MKRYRKSVVVLLMTISQVLITVFVIYWLMGQYNDEKRLLQRELNRGFMGSERIMIDSMLNIHLIEPILNDSTNNKLKISISIDSSDDMTRLVLNDSTNNKLKISIPIDSSDDDMSRLVHQDEMMPFEGKRGFRNVDFAYVRLDSLTKNDTLGRHLRNSMDTSDSYLFHGARLLFSRMRGMDHNESSRASFISSNADTLILMNAFGDFLTNNEYDFLVQWLPINEDFIHTQDGILIVSRALNGTFGATIDNYQIYLIKDIFPQILFAIILLLITLTSFRISHLNIKKQKRLLRIKNEFINNVTHELKTPVATVKVALEALLDFDMKKDPAVVQDYLEMSLLEMNRLDLLVSKVLNNSVLENGNNLFDPEQINLVQLVEEVIQSQKYRFEKSGAEIQFISGIKEANVLFDKLHMQGVLLNLIDNSLKYSGSHVQIELRLNKHASDFVIGVKDNGPGIPKEYLDKVFDKFFRVPTNDQHNVKGYGLGLNYAQLVMKHHGGEISVKNLNEGGCEFMLTIPINQA